MALFRKIGVDEFAIGFVSYGASVLRKYKGYFPTRNSFRKMRHLFAFFKLELGSFRKTGHARLKWNRARKPLNGEEIRFMRNLQAQLKAAARARRVRPLRQSS